MADDAMAAENTATDNTAPDNTQMDGAGASGPGGDLAEADFDVVVKPIDPDSPLYSVKTFEELGLPDNLLKGIYGMNFSRPSKIQESALPLILNDPPVNLIAQSQSGTGKTAAFTLNILKRVDVSTPQMQITPQALVLAPTRELARQIQGVIQTMGTYIAGLKVGLAVPVDVSQRGQKVEASVVVGTPGTATDLAKRRLLDTRAVKVVVLDEADNMLEASMGEQCQRIKAALPRNIQVLLFSATWPEHVVLFARQFAPNSNEMTLPQAEQSVEGIKQLYMDCSSEEEKFEVLVKLYGMMTVGQSVIFVKTRATAAKIAQRMTAEGHECTNITGELTPSERDTVIDRFRTGAAKVLIATNVLARGIDVQSVSMVINYDIPDLPGGQADAETYLHRIGRTGRFGRVGVAISFVHDQRSWTQLSSIAEHFNMPMTRVETKDWDQVEEIIEKVIKNPAAQAGYRPERMEGGGFRHVPTQRFRLPPRQPQQYGLLPAFKPSNPPPSGFSSTSKGQGFGQFGQANARTGGNTGMSQPVQNSTWW